MLTLVVGCTSGSEGQNVEPARASDRDVDGWSDREVVDAVEQYVSALADGDAAQADELRCRDQQFGTEHHDLIVTMSEHIAADLGGLTLAEATVVMRGDDGWTVSATLEGSDSPLNVLVVPDGGTVKVCGQSAPNWRDVRETLSEVEVVSVPWTAPIEDVLACGGVDGATSVASEVPESQPADDDRGVVGRWSSKWQDGDVTNRLVVTQYETPELAAVAQFNDEGIYLNNAVAAIDASHVQNARAIRFLSEYMTFVQPPGAGDQSDALMVRYDDTVVSVTHGPATEAAQEPVVVRIAMCVEALLTS